MAAQLPDLLQIVMFRNTPIFSPMTTHLITTLSALRQLYGPARERALKKEIPALDAHAVRFIGLSPFVVLASSDAQGQMDASPRGGDAGFVKVLDAQTLLVPDAPGNNRLDTLENIIATGRLGTLFMVPGFDETLRVNGRAVLSTDPADLALCADARRTPALVIRLTVESVYLHCAKAFMRSGLWDVARHTDRAQLPSMGEMMRDQIRNFRGEEIEVEAQAEMLARYQQSL
jgi:PPOX class probable FMN-dependent enzyme